MAALSLRGLFHVFVSKAVLPVTAHRSNNFDAAMVKSEK